MPLDYTDPSIGTTGIAFIKWSANDQNCSSPPQDILLNPGGPGLSGVELLQNSLPILQSFLGTSNNLVGFDPRGVGASGPDLSCFPRREGGTIRYHDRDFGDAVDAESPKSIAETFARAGAFGDWCSAIHSANNDTSKFANTVATANDMLHYAEKLAELKGENKDDAKLWYYGTSYGTLLGATYASLFPNRIGRMILDSVIDGEDYYQGKWLSSLADADEAVSTFFQYCYEGGADACPFWADSPEAIRERYNTVVEDLKANPIVVADPKLVQRPTIVTIAEFKNILVQIPYRPLATFPFLAQMLALLEQRNGTLLAPIQDTTIEDGCKTPLPNLGNVEPRYYIACSDANGRHTLETINAWTEHLNKLVDQSQYLGEAWASGTAIACRHLKIDTPRSHIFEGVPSANKTSAPILFVSNKLDPVTPLRNAEKVRRLFPGSGLLVQNIVGHNLFAASSECTNKYTKQYISDLSLPPEGTVCEAENFPPFVKV